MTGCRGRVLVVNDDARLASSVQSLLAGQGYEARTANDGMAALRVLAAWPADLVLLDLMMPRLDGFGFLQLQQKRQPIEPAESDPAVLVWSVADDGQLEEARQLGASECLPMASTTPDSLLDAISRLLARRALIASD
jgi:CheY-like chemotaxis protein